MGRKNVYEEAESAFAATDFYQENVKALIWKTIVARTYMIKCYTLHTGEQVIVQFYEDGNFMVFYPD